METIVEQRKDVRSDLTWPVSVWLPEANRFFNGKSVNVSKGGAYISVPMTTPVRPGHKVEINFRHPEISRRFKSSTGGFSTKSEVN